MVSRRKNLPVALTRCVEYGTESLDRCLERVAGALGISVSRGSVVLLKPNLVSATSNGHFGCTSPAFVSAVARWFIGRGAKVKVGDSPAFGTSRMVMRSVGMSAELKRIGAEPVNFSRCRTMKMPCGLSVPIAEEALECDLLVNLPKVKAHSQLYVSLAVKNYFGVVCGWQKALHHARHGDIGNRFEALLVDLPGLFPESLTIADGIFAMHVTGPVRGEEFPLGVAGAAFDPVALDTALMQIIGADPDRSIIMQECIRREIPGTDQGNISYILEKPDRLAVGDFVLPDILKPVTFHPVRMAVSGGRRFLLKFRRE